MVICMSPRQVGQELAFAECSNVGIGFVKSVARVISASVALRMCHIRASGRPR
jgi:hypothetical protein